MPAITPQLARRPLQGSKTMPQRILIGFVLFVALGWACTPDRASRPPLFEVKESSMSVGTNLQPPDPAIPSIDAAAPAHFETASFGLG